MEFFSDNTILMHTVDRDPYEILTFLDPDGNISNQIFDISRHVWTRPIFLYGHTYPTIPKELLIPPYTLTDFQIGYVDTASKYKLSELFNNNSESLHKLQLESKKSHLDLADKQSKEKKENFHRHKSIKQLYIDEVSGCLKEYKSLLKEVLSCLFYHSTSANIEPMKIPDEDMYDVMLSMLNELKKTGSNRLPFLRIPCLLHSISRWNKSRNYNQNDYYDFRHANNALPHYDYFFSENSLFSSIESKAFKTYSNFRCITVSRIDSSIAILKGLE